MPACSAVHSIGRFTAHVFMVTENGVSQINPQRDEFLLTLEPCSPIPAHSTEHSCVFLLFTALSTAMCHSAQHHWPSLPSAPHCAPCPHLSSHSAHHTALCGCWEPGVCTQAWAGLLCGAELIPYGVGGGGQPQDSTIPTDHPSPTVLSLCAIPSQL